MTTLGEEYVLRHHNLLSSTDCDNGESGLQSFIPGPTITPIEPSLLEIGQVALHLGRA